jgi:hypothetical protein
MSEELEEKDLEDFDPSSLDGEDCHMRCPCGRMKNWYCEGEHPSDKKSSGYLCPACGMVGPSSLVSNKSLVARPVESSDFEKASLLTYIKLGKVELPIPFGHGFFFNVDDGRLMYSPHAFHLEDRKSWSMDSDFPLEIPESVDVRSKAGFWAMMSSVILMALDGHTEASKWHVVYEIASSLENEERARAILMKRYESCQLVIAGLSGPCISSGGEALKIELKKLRPNLSVKDISKELKALPFTVGRYNFGQCLQIQRDLFALGAYVQIKP